MNVNLNAYPPSLNASKKVVEVDSNKIKTNFTERISKEEAIELRAKIMKNANEMMLKSISIQVNVSNKKDDFSSLYESFLNDIAYNGKPVAKLSQNEATEFISEDGIFGIKQTSQRIANFVINGAAGDEDRLRAGREGMIQGFKDAERMWGGKLPEISQKTMQAAIEMVDKAMNEAGFSILNEEA